MKLRVLAVGLSQHADEVLLPSLAEIPQFELACVVSRDPEKARHFQDKFHAERRATDWREALAARDISCVVVSGPPTFHEVVTIESLARRLPIFIEKPCATSLASIQHLAKLSGDSPTVQTFVGYNFRHADSYKELISLARGDGGICHIEISFLTNKPLRPLWNYSTTLESFMYAIAIHPIEIVHSILGSPAAVRTALEPQSHGKFKLTIGMEYSNSSAVLHVGNYVDHFFCQYRIRTPERVLALCPTAGNAIGISPDKKRDYGYVQELQSFATSILNQTETTAPLSESIPIYRTIDAVLRQLK